MHFKSKSFFSPPGQSIIDAAAVADQEAAVVPEANHHGDEKGML